MSTRPISSGEQAAGRSEAAAEGSATDDRSRGSDLCTDCGLCCSGALHEVAALKPSEVEDAKALGLVIADRERLCFELPCPRLEGNVCTVYQQRPVACGQYRCEVLIKLERGSISLEQGLKRVAAAKQLVARLQESAPGNLTLMRLRSLALDERSPASPEKGEVELDRQTKLAAIALNLFLDRHFRPKTFSTDRFGSPLTWG